MATTTPSTPAATSGDGGGCRTTSNNSWQAVTARLAALLEPAGFDIVHALPVQLLLDGQQAAGNSSEADALPTYGRTSTLALLIGNSAALWQPFVAHVARAGGPAAAGAHPLDAYTERHVTAALQQLPIAHHVRFAHHMESGHFFDALRAARVSGLAFVSPVTHLAVHPVFGPWFALRALAVCDVDGADPSSFKPLPCPHPDLEEAAAQRVCGHRGGRAHCNNYDVEKQKCWCVCVLGGVRDGGEREREP